MSHNATLPAFAAAFAVVLAAIALAGPSDIQFDDPMLPLDPAYHDVPSSLIADLRTNQPTRPYGFINHYCYPKYHRAYRGVEYCICFDTQGCRELMASNQCGAKLGELTPGVGVCRMSPNDEKVTITR